LAVGCINQLRPLVDKGAAIEVGRLTTELTSLQTRIANLETDLDSAHKEREDARQGHMECRDFLDDLQEEMGVDDWSSIRSQFRQMTRELRDQGRELQQVQSKLLMKLEKGSKVDISRSPSQSSLRSEHPRDTFTPAVDQNGWQIWAHLQDKSADADRRERVMKFEKFGGDFGAATTEFEEWLDRFKFMFSDASDEFKAQSLRHVLTDKALMSYQHLSEAQRASSFQVICDLLQKDLSDQSGARRTNLLRELQTLRQGRDTIAVFIANLDKLAQRAMPAATYSATAVAELKTATLLTGIRSEGLQARIHAKSGMKSDAVEGYAFLCQEAINSERNETRLAELSGDKEHNNSPSNGRSSKSEQPQGSSQNFIFNKFKSKGENFKGGNNNESPTNQSSHNQSTSKQWSRRSLNCLYCERDGHEAQYCFENPESRSYKGNRTNDEKSNGSKAKSSAVSSVVLKTAEIVDPENSNLMNRLIVGSVDSKRNNLQLQRLIGPKIYLKISVFGREMLGFVDSGSDTTIVPLSQLQKLGKEMKWTKIEANRLLKVASLPHGLRMVAVNGTNVKAIGVVTLPVNHSGVVSEVTAIIQDDEDSPEEGYGLLLGTNALEYVGISINNNRSGETIDLKRGGQYVEIGKGSRGVVTSENRSPPVKVHVNRVTVCHRVLQNVEFEKGLRDVVTSENCSLPVKIHVNRVTVCHRVFLPARFRRLLEFKRRFTGEESIVSHPQDELKALYKGKLLEGIEMERVSLSITKTSESIASESASTIRGQEKFEEKSAHVHIDDVLTGLRKSRLRLKPGQCTFGRNEYDFLGQQRQLCKQARVELLKNEKGGEHKVRKKRLHQTRSKDPATLQVQADESKRPKECECRSTDMVDKVQGSASSCRVVEGSRFIGLVKGHLVKSVAKSVCYRSEDSSRGFEEKSRNELSKKGAYKTTQVINRSSGGNGDRWKCAIRGRISSTPRECVTVE
jgi:hypothetical protein